MPSKKVTAICLLVPLVFILFAVMGGVDAEDEDKDKQVKCYVQTAEQDTGDWDEVKCDTGKKCYVATKCTFTGGKTNDLRGCVPNEADEVCTGMYLSDYGPMHLNKYCKKCRTCDKKKCNGVLGTGKFGLVGSAPWALLFGFLSLVVGGLVQQTVV